MSLRDSLQARLYDFVMKRPEKKGVNQWRRTLLEHARGDVLEIGVGTGANLAHYPQKVSRLVALDPNPAMVERINIDEFRGTGPVEVVQGVAAELPLDDNEVDTVVCTLVLCSVPDMEQALAEIRRVLRPGGQFLFLEHVASPEEDVRRWQDRVDPLWNRMVGDCHMNRRTSEAIDAAGFRCQEFRREPMPSAPSLLRPTIRGIAVSDK